MFIEFDGLDTINSLKVFAGQTFSLFLPHPARRMLPTPDLDDTGKVVRK